MDQMNGIDAASADRIRILRPYMHFGVSPAIAALSCPSSQIRSNNRQSEINCQAYEKPPPAYEEVIKQPPLYGKAAYEGVANPACNQDIV
jgi:hypothetical protein